MTIARTPRGKTGKIVALCLGLMGGIFGPGAALPQSLQTGPQDSVRSFYDVLLTTMKNAQTLGQSGRYAALAPVVNSLFDVPSMARLAVGPAWDTLTPTQQQQITRRSVAMFLRLMPTASTAIRASSSRSSATCPMAAGSSSRPRSSGPPAPVTINYMMRPESGRLADLRCLSRRHDQPACDPALGVPLDPGAPGVGGLISTLAHKADLLSSNVPRTLPGLSRFSVRMAFPFFGPLRSRLSREGHESGCVAWIPSGKGIQTWITRCTESPARNWSSYWAHEPDFADEAAYYPVDLQLSGHSHGGQIWLPGIGAPWLPPLAKRYPRGLYRIGPLILYTNVGLGTIRLPIRLNCPPEVTLFHATCAQPTIG